MKRRQSMATLGRRCIAAALGAVIVGATSLVPGTVLAQKRYDPGASDSEI